MKFALVFIGMIAVDYFWGRYVRAMGACSAAVAAHWATLLAVVSAFVTISYVQEPMLLAPAGAGAWLGTYIAAKQGSTSSAQQKGEKHADQSSTT